MVLVSAGRSPHVSTSLKKDELYLAQIITVKPFTQNDIVILPPDVLRKQILTRRFTAPTYKLQTRRSCYFRGPCGSWIAVSLLRFFLVFKSDKSIFTCVLYRQLGVDVRARDHWVQPQIDPVSIRSEEYSGLLSFQGPSS
ncbi:hypothetical protein PM082_019208 [Marasmius tenuissimus]|nr:hypothetical protein PM082_019208 [Marasmius tenuissimus]